PLAYSALSPPSSLHGAADHPVLHSFPTRRSSDLGAQEPPASQRDQTHCLQMAAVIADLRVPASSAPRRRRQPDRPSRRPARCDPDRKSTRLNSSHGSISYAVFCLKKKNKHTTTHS